MSRSGLARRLGLIVPDFSATAADFPVPALISILLFVYVQLDYSGAIADGWAVGNRVYLSGAAAFIASGAAHYFARSSLRIRSPSWGDRPLSIPLEPLYEAASKPGSSHGEPLGFPLDDEVTALITATDGKRGESIQLRTVTLWLIIGGEAP